MNKATFNIVAVAQAGRLSFEALLLAASLRKSDPGFKGRLFLAMPQQGDLWPHDPAVHNGPILDLYAEYGAEILPFENRHFGATYPQGNKIECLAALPSGENFLFLDTDTLITGKLSKLRFDFARPSASMRREATWPEPQLYKVGYPEIWGALYDRFGLEFPTSQDVTYAPDDWRRYLYFNAGWFFGADPTTFGARFAEWAISVRDDPPPELAAQSFDPWLDQVILPLVIHAFGGGRPGPELAGLDGAVTCHWRALPLLYAQESEATQDFLADLVRPNRLKKVLKTYEPFQRMIWQGGGDEVKALLATQARPRTEKVLRNRLKAAGLWHR